MIAVNQLDLPLANISILFETWVGGGGLFFDRLKCMGPGGVILCQIKVRIELVYSKSCDSGACSTRPPPCRCPLPFLRCDGDG